MVGGSDPDRLAEAGQGVGVDEDLLLFNEGVVGVRGVQEVPAVVSQFVRQDLPVLVPGHPVGTQDDPPLTPIVFTPPVAVLELCPHQPYLALSNLVAAFVPGVIGGAPPSPVKPE